MLNKDISNNETPELCRECGGRCCRNYGCGWSVDDFVREFGDVTVENVIKGLKTGLIAIDWWEGDYRDQYDIDYPYQDERERCFFIRSRHVNENDCSWDGSWGGICISLTEHGCRFDWDHRPLGGKGLIPQKNKEDPHLTDCIEINRKIEFVNDWFPYSEILEDAKETIIACEREIKRMEYGQCHKRSMNSNPVGVVDLLPRKRL